MEKNINRRDFLKLSGAALGSAALAGCQPKSAATSGTPASGSPVGEMEYRINPGNGDKVSLLGYGCMRWPQKPGPDGKEVIDQEKVNELVDYAIDHGVNYFDTSPAYLGGESERASAIALNRHPRKDFFWATKLSNFRDASREASLRMYRDSFEQLQTDYIDYYLLHSIGRFPAQGAGERGHPSAGILFPWQPEGAGRTPGPAREIPLGLCPDPDELHGLAPCRRRAQCPCRICL